jgi:ribosomal protein S13
MPYTHLPVHGQRTRTNAQLGKNNVGGIEEEIIKYALYSE